MADLAKAYLSDKFEKDLANRNLRRDVPLIGDQRPRLESIPPIRFNNASEDCIGLAGTAGLYLDDWQKYVLAGMLGQDESHLWSAFEVLIIVSRQNGKGSILEARELFGLFVMPSDRLLIHTAHEHKTSSEHFLRVWSLIENTPELSKQVLAPAGRHSTAYGREFIETKPKPTIILGAGGRQIRRKGRKRLIFIARSGTSGRGFTGDLVVYDEDMTLDAGKVAASLPSLSARPNPQVVYAGSAGLPTSTQLANVRRRGVAKTSKRLAFYEWSIDPHDEDCPRDCTDHAGDDPDSEESIAKANPAYGIRIMPRYIESEREAFEGMPEEFNRERLGVGTYPAPADGWLVIPKAWYARCADKTDRPPRVQSPIFAIDAAPNRRHAAIAVAGRRPDKLTGIQVIDYREDIKWIVKRAIEIHEKWKPRYWIVDKRAAAGSLVTELTNAGLPIEWLQASQVAHASGLLYDAFKEGDLRHYAQDELRKALAGADQRKLSESWAFDRINSGVDISPLMAVTLANWGLMEFGEEDYDAQESLHFDLEEIARYWRAGVYGPPDIKRLFDSKILTIADLEVLANEGIHP